jgi:hypothetical protein
MLQQACAAGRTQAYPTRPVRIVVGYAAGGGTDIVARLIGQWLSERLGQQFIIENRPGGNSNIGTEAVVRAPPDGYTLLVVDCAPAINATYYKTLNFSFIRDIAPVAGIARQAGIMVVHPSVPTKTVPEFIAYAKANPGKLNMASATGYRRQLQMAPENCVTARRGQCQVRADNPPSMVRSAQIHQTKFKPRIVRVGGGGQGPGFRPYSTSEVGGYPLKWGAVGSRKRLIE